MREKQLTHSLVMILCFQIIISVRRHNSTGKKVQFRETTVKGHLINCTSILELKRFLKLGYVGLGPFYPQVDSTKRQIIARLRILWDVVADLKRVRPGDIAFLHSEGRIFGPFIFETTFRESENLPDILSSPNLTPSAWIANRRKFDSIDMDEYGYVAAIAKPVGNSGNDAGLMEIFLRQSMGIFNGIPPRFMYGDTKKIVKPLLFHEVLQLLEILYFSGDWTIEKHSTYSAASLDEIQLDLSDYGGHVFCEKLLEAWFMENMFPGTPGYDNIVKILDNFSYYANSVYTYYTNFLDVLAYNCPHPMRLSYCHDCGSMLRNTANDIRIVELKRNSFSDGAKVLGQINSYLKWGKSVLNPNSKVKGYIVAPEFDSEFCTQCKKLHNGRVELIRYQIRTKGLVLESIS